MIIIAKFVNVFFKVMNNSEIENLNTKSITVSILTKLPINEINSTYNYLFNSGV